VSRRRLIVNADDFGRSTPINRGIVRAHRAGIVTSTSLMVRGSAVPEAVALASQCPALSLGLHIELGDWAYFDGSWVEVDHVVATDKADDVAREVERQVERFVALTGRPPAHLDTHQHVHRNEPARAIVAAWGDRLGVRVRDVTPGITYRGDFYGQDGKGCPCHELIAVDALLALLDALPVGVTELGCHPGEWPDAGAGVYGVERSLELAALCDPRVRAWCAAGHVELG
jgi:chitin disaccharide deacetylase